MVVDAFTNIHNKHSSIYSSSHRIRTQESGSLSLLTYSNVPIVMYGIALVLDAGIGFSGCDPMFDYPVN